MIALMLKNQPNAKLPRYTLFSFKEIETKAGAISRTKTTKTPASETDEVTVRAKSEKNINSFKKPLVFG